MESKCRKCGAVNAEKIERRNVDVKAGSRSYSLTADAAVCTACGEFDWEGMSLELAESKACAMLAEEGPRTGADFRALRQELAMTAAEVGGLLDVAPETVSRWENGERVVPRMALAMIAGLVLEHREKKQPLLKVLQAYSASARADG